MTTRLRRDFFERPTLLVAQELLRQDPLLSRQTGEDYGN